MQISKLQAGQTYYIESRPSSWDEPKFRDIKNEFGGHKARLESLTRYRQTSAYEVRYRNMPRYIEDPAGAFLSVTVLAATGSRPETRGWNDRDRVEYVRAREFRAEWDQTVEETQAVLDARALRAQEKANEAAAEQGRRDHLVARAASTGLKVAARKSTMSGKVAFEISEENLTDFLDALEALAK